MSDALEPVLIADPGEVRRLPLPAGFDKSNALIFSASQFESWGLCNRKWLGEKGFKLPVREKGSQTFGKALHGVCERYLKADDLGRDADGQEVDLYPEGWAEGLDNVDADLIQKLIARAIEGDGKGRQLLVRHPRRMIEHGFLRQLMVVDGITVFITGFIDMLRPFEAIEDHKSTKDLKWAKNDKVDSEEYLGNQRQMLIYARELLVLAEEQGEPAPKEILLRHNYFCKNKAKPSLKAVEVMVSAAKVRQHWEDLKPIAAEMVRSRARWTEVNEWHTLPLPKSMARACNAFGGCSFMSLCGTAPDQFQDQLKRYLQTTESAMSATQVVGRVGMAAQGVNGSVPVTPPPGRVFNLIDPTTTQIRQSDEAGLLALMQQFGPELHVLLNGEASAAWKTPADYGIVLRFVPSPPPAPALPAPPPQAPAPVKLAAAIPPWAIPGCGACTGSGFNSAGNPCRICYGQAKPENQPQHFDITADGQGNVTWTRKGGQQPMPAAPPAAAITVTATPAAPVQLSPELLAMQQQIANRIEQEQAAVGGAPATPEQTAAPKRGPGRPKKAAGTPPPAPPTQVPQATPPAPAVSAPALSTGTTAPSILDSSDRGFVLLLNCIPSRSNEPVLDLALVLEKWGSLLGQQRGMNYHLLETFERRNVLGSQAAQIAAELTGYVVARIDRGSDLSALANVLRPFALEVIEAAA